MTSRETGQDLVASDEHREIPSKHDFGLHLEPSPAENPFADPISPTPIHRSPQPAWPLQQPHFQSSSLSAGGHDSRRLFAPATPLSGRSSANTSVVSLAASDDNGLSSGLLRKTSKSPHGFFPRIKDKIFSHVDPKSMIHLMDFRPWFWPITPKKYFVLFLIACAIAAIVVSEVFFHWIEKSLAITRSTMLPVLIISVCAEPVIIMIILPVAKIPDIPKADIDMIMNRESDDVEVLGRRMPEGPFETALVIPCHDTDEAAMRTTLESAFLSFRPQDIFIVDNGRSKYPKHPTCNFREYIRKIHPDIVYIWSPIGSKNVAQFVGALAAKDYKYIMTVDDDVCIPKNFRPPTEMIDDKFKAVAYPLKAMDANCNVPLFLVAWQDVEYRLSGLSKLAEDRLCGVQYPHGAGWFVERESFITLLEYHHPMDFIAEDCNAGLGLSKMGKGIHIDARSFLATEVPTTFFGPGLNWWKQRQKSWEMGRHGRTFAFIQQLLFGLPIKRTLQAIVWYKTTYLYLICTNIIDWLRVAIFVAFGNTGTWWRNAILLMLFSAIPPLIYKYIKCRRRPDLAPRFWAALTYPFYKQLYSLVSLFGAIRCVGYYFGGHVRPLNIQQMLKAKDEKCFWLDPRFETNPAFLADEAEAQETKPSEEPKQSLSCENPDGNAVDIRNSVLEPLPATFQVPGSHDLPPPTRSSFRSSPRLSSSGSSMHRSQSATSSDVDNPDIPYPALAKSLARPVLTRVESPQLAIPVSDQAVPDTKSGVTKQ